MRVDWRAFVIAIVIEAALCGFAMFGGPHGNLGAIPWMLQLPGILFVFLVGSQGWFFVRVGMMFVVQTAIWYGITVFIRRRRAVVILPVLLCVAGCPREAYLRLAEGSSAAQLTVVAGRRHGGPATAIMDELSIARCNAGRRPEDQLWWTGASGAGEHYVAQVVYGKAPSGWRSSGTAPVLTPGCYRAEMGAWPGVVTFDVDSAGGVMQRPGSDE